MIIEEQTFDQERALYGAKDVLVKNCRFDGPADGESALKESSNIQASSCFMNLRYPFWHVDKATISKTEFTENCRAALWYDKHICIEQSKLYGIKALRECENVTLKNCKIESLQGFCYMQNLRLENCELINTTLAFEFSDVHAEIIGEIYSVKNPRSGLIKAAKIRELIQDGATDASKTEIITELRA